MAVRRLGLFLLLVSVSFSPAMAQAPFVAGQIADPARCHLHVWPAAQLDAVTQALMNHVVNQAFDPARGGIARPDVLSLESQRAQLAGLDLPGMFRLEGAQLVIHEQPAPRPSPAAPQAPIVQPVAPCHVELVIGRLIYDHAPMAPHALKTLVSIRSFAAGGDLLASYTAWGETPLRRFPPRAGEDPSAAAAELVAAFGANLQQVAAWAAVPADQKGRRKRPSTSSTSLP
ncbi:MAG: hypothetical protein SNJ79_01510 [Sphingomonadaceae bacterium]